MTKRARREALPTALLVAATLAVTAPTASAQSTLRVPLPRDGGQLTPLTFTLGYPLLTLVYDTLMWRDESGVPRPWLARSLRISADGRRVLVALRRGARWHDGRALTARDVAFTYAFMRARRQPRFRPQLAAIASVRALDRDTVEFRLRHRSPGFADQPLADVPILPAHVWRGVGPGLRAPAGLPVGSGPYRLAGRRADGGYRFEAVPGYFRGRPQIDRIDVPIIPGAQDMLTDLRRGRLDALPFTLTREQQAAVRGLGVRIAHGPLYLGTSLMFNLRRPPFDRPALRRAVAAALESPRIARAAGAAPATAGVLHPRSRWAPRRLVAPARAADDGTLASLGLPEIRVLTVAADPVRLEAGRQVVLAIRRAGGAARLVAMSRGRLGRAVGEGGGAADFDAAIWSVPALASYDPDYLAPVFGSGGALNRSGYSSATFDRLSRRVATAPSTRSRRTAVGALLSQLSHDAPVAPLLFTEGAFAYRPATHDGWSFVAGSGILHKRSLLRASPVRAAGIDDGRPATGGGGGPGLFGILAIAGIAVALLSAGAAIAARRR